MGGFLPGAIGQEEQDEDDRQAERDNNREAVARPHLVLVLTRPLEEVARVEANPLLDDLLCLVDERPHVPPPDVQEDTLAEQPVLRGNHRRPGLDANVRDLAERNVSHLPDGSRSRWR